jgi:hypothetical protein
MRSRLASAAALLWTLTVAAAADEPSSATSGASATLPLEQLLELHDQARVEKPKLRPPPLAGAVTEAVLNGRLLEHALEVTAQFKVVVLAEEWVRIPLLQLDPTLRVQSVTAPEGGMVAIEKNSLVLVTRTPGQQGVQVSLLKGASTEGRRRRAALVLHRAAASQLRLRFDGNLFRLLNPNAVQAGEEQVVYPDRDRFALEWELRSERTPVAQARARPTPVEPVITSARASVVGTLDGVQISRLTYDLRLQGRQPIRFTIPPGNTLSRVLLNGAPLPFTVEDGALRVSVEPGRSGDETARLELELQGERREFHLSGRLELTFPAASWRTDLFTASLHLPKVFDYTWAGGSLAPTGDAPEEPSTGGFPMPGKVFHFQQELVSSAPEVAVDYTVDLEGQYFGG